MITIEELIKIGEELKANHTEIHIHHLTSDWLKRQYKEYKIHSYPCYINICIFPGSGYACPVDTISVNLNAANGSSEQLRLDFEGNYWEVDYKGNWSAYKTLSSEDAEILDKLSRAVDDTEGEYCIITKQHWMNIYPDGTVI